MTDAGVGDDPDVLVLGKPVNGVEEDERVTSHHPSRETTPTLSTCIDNPRQRFNDVLEALFREEAASFSFVHGHVTHFSFLPYTALVDKPNILPPEVEAEKLAELQALLNAAGVINFSARELTLLLKALPKHCEFPRDLTPLVSIAIVAQEIRSSLGAPLVVSSAYRPLWYNKIVANSTDSAHIEACAIDLNARNSDEALKMHSIIYKLWKQRVFNGYGKYSKLRTRAHIDIGKKGHRRWTY